MRLLGPHGPVLAGAARSGYVDARAEVAELADAEDSKSSARKGVGVRLPSSAVSEIKDFCRIHHVFISAAANPSYSRREGPVESTIENDRGGSSMSRTSAHVNRTRLGVVVLALAALLHGSAVIPRAAAAVPSPT